MVGIRILFFLIPEKIAKMLTHPFTGLGRKFAFLFPGLKYDLRLIDSPFDEGQYLLASLMNAFFWALLVFILVYALMASRGMINAHTIDQLRANKAVFLPPLITFIIFFLFFVRYPRVLAGKLVEAVDKDLIYALNDLLLEIASGVSLYNALLNTSRSGYGRVSQELEIVVREISTGVPQDVALERMAMRTESSFLRKAIWQLVTALKSGASLKGAISSVISNLRQYQSSEVKSYTQELNLWVLLFVIVSVAIPSLGVTFLVILSTFGGVELGANLILTLLFGCFLAEFVLIEFIRVRRPVLRI